MNDLATERVPDMVVEQKVVALILEQASENSLTISNIRDIANKAISYLEKNAVLNEKVEDLSQVKSSTETGVKRICTGIVLHL